MKIIECDEQIKNGVYTHREIQEARTSIVWDFFHEIFDDSGNKIEQFFYCIECKSVQYSARLYGSTTKLLRHPCVTPATFNELNFNANDIEKIERAAAKFVCVDLRPFNAVECSGLRDLILASVELGKKYPKIKSEDISKVLPSRKTVKSIITKEANKAKDAIKILFKNAIEQNGFGCTLDLWTDKFNSNTYMALTANIPFIRDTGIEQKSVVFYMGYFDDIVKSKELVRSRIIKVFCDMGVSNDELKENVTFTTDR